jgi:hypothetical protein
MANELNGKRIAFPMANEGVEPEEFAEGVHEGRRDRVVAG